MANPKEPGEKPAEIPPASDADVTLSLVDYFDRVDREAFRRMLRDHDRTEHLASGG